MPRIKSREKKARMERKFKGEIVCYFINSSKLSHKLKKKHINSITLKYSITGLNPSIKIV